MMLAEPQPTPFDLRFRLFGTAVSVHPFFWLMAVLLGWNLVNKSPIPGDNGMMALALWIAVVFVSILLHEFGHVWMGKVFGTDGYIVLHGFGGLAIGSNALYSSWKRILVSAAGPAIQLALWGALFAMRAGGLFRGLPPALSLFLDLLIYVNLAWPILNLLPIWPLDGGQITREVCVLASPDKGVETSLWISLVVSATLAVNAFVGMRGDPIIPYTRPLTGQFLGIFFALDAVGSWQALQAVRARKSWVDDHREW